MLKLVACLHWRNFYVIWKNFLTFLLDARNSLLLSFIVCSQNAVKPSPHGQHRPYMACFYKTTIYFVEH